VLGRFLEFSIATADIRASADFYGRLGFSQLQVGEAWPHPYAALTDGRITLGLHQAAIPAPSLTFVRPNLIKHLDALERLGVAPDFRRLGNDVFNELGWHDPSGHLIRLIEARTFSPSKRSSTAGSLCGYFTEIALPTPDVAGTKDYWERFGFVGLDDSDAPLPHVSCTSDHLDLGLYDPAHLRQPTLVFDPGEVSGTVAKLADAGISTSHPLPGPLRQLPAAMLLSPEGTPILLLPARDP
jgi:catechol 2,3-dioxygenase-like lactoylglutathione lyase family enzyme